MNKRFSTSWPRQIPDPVLREKLTPKEPLGLQANPEVARLLPAWSSCRTSSRSSAASSASTRRTASSTSEGTSPRARRDRLRHRLRHPRLHAADGRRRPRGPDRRQALGGGRLRYRGIGLPGHAQLLPAQRSLRAGQLGRDPDLPARRGRLPDAAASRSSQRDGHALAPTEAATDAFCGSPAQGAPRNDVLAVRQLVHRPGRHARSSGRSRARSTSTSTPRSTSPTSTPSRRAAARSPRRTRVSTPKPGALAGIRVVEVGDRLGEYCGLVLAGLGAEVVRVEPPEGVESRRMGPFVDDVPDPERSLHFWAYNRGKRSVVLDLETDDGRAGLEELAAASDVLLDATPFGYLDERGLGSAALRERHPALVVARITPFGEDGPRKDWKATDLVHLALGGQVMNNGYDPDPSGHYDLPPVAAQLDHSYAVAGEQLAFTVIAALISRRHTGCRPAPVVRRPRGARQEHRGRPDVVDLPADAVQPPDLPPLGARRVDPPLDLRDQGRPLDPRLDPQRQAARTVPRQVRHRRRHQRRQRREAPGLAGAARHGGRRGPQHGRRRAHRPPLPLRGRALARGPGGRPDVGARAQAARVGVRRALAPARHLRRRRAPRAGALAALPDEQVDRVRDLLGHRAPGAEAGPGPRPAADHHAADPRARPSRRPRPAVGARQAVGPAGRADPRLHLDARLGRRDPLPRLARRRRDQGRVAQEPRPAPWRQPRRRPGGARAGHRSGAVAVAGRPGRPGRRAVQQQEPRQARHLPQRQAPEGARAGPPHGRREHRGLRGLLARGDGELGPRLRRAAQDQVGHHLRQAVRHGHAGHLRPVPHHRTGGPGVRRHVGDERAGRPVPARGLGLLLPRLVRRLQLRARRAQRDLPPRRDR